MTSSMTLAVPLTNNAMLAAWPGKAPVPAQRGLRSVRGAERAGRALAPRPGLDATKIPDTYAAARALQKYIIQPKSVVKSEGMRARDTRAL